MHFSFCPTICILVTETSVQYRMSVVRKDVEDCFGIMKRRFRILRVPSMFRYEINITNSFKTCCILHNMLLDWDDIGSHGHGEEDWIAQDKSDLTKIMEDIRKRREEVKRPRNPSNRRPPPSNPLDEVSNTSTSSHAPYQIGTDNLSLYYRITCRL